MTDILTDGTDVTDVPSRELILRAVNSTLATEYTLGRLASAVSQIANEVRILQDLVRRVTSLEGTRDMREKAASLHDVQELIDEVIEKTNPELRTSSDRVRSMVTRELNERAGKFTLSALGKVVVAILVAAGVAGAFALGHLLR
jgi:hypothetical protein